MIGQRKAAKGATEIAVPASVYFEDFEVVLDGKAVAQPKWDRMSGVLSLTPDRSRSEHFVCIAPVGVGACPAGLANPGSSSVPSTTGG